MDSVQFRGIENVLQAFQLNEVETWGIWQKKNLITKGTGIEDLRTFLEMLKNNDSQAIYTLKVFEDIDDPKKIKENSSADGSFNFRLYADTPGTFDGGLDRYAETNRKNKLFERIEAIEERIGLIADGESEAQEDTFMDKVIGVISDPQQLREYVDIFKNLFSNDTPAPVYRPAGTIGNASAMNDKQVKQPPTAQDMQRLSAALDILSNADPKIIDHLEQLATLAQDKPKKFNSLLSMMETFL